MKQPLYGTKSTKAWDTLTESKWKLKSSEISLSLLRILNWKHEKKNIQFLQDDGQKTEKWKSLLSTVKRKRTTKEILSVLFQKKIPRG